jgi:lactate racemase
MIGEPNISAPLRDEEVHALVAKVCPASNHQGKRILVLVPDSTRTAPVGLLFRALHQQIAPATKSFDVLVALGTHQPMTEEGIRDRLEISVDERNGLFREVRFYNHEWSNPTALKQVGTLQAEEVSSITDGLFSMDVDVEINRLVFDYDQVIIVGPVFPHEVVGFSGGNKYLFPGIGGPKILNFFHWLGAVITNPKIIGQKWTPVRKVVDRAAAMVNVQKLCFCMVVNPDKTLAGLFAGTPEQAWDEASELSRQIHITYKPQPFRTILACAPTMYDELWTAGKCMYKLEPVLAEGGELIIYAPHLREICISHGNHIKAIGYHCRDFFLKQWDRYKHYPWGVLAHSTHVRGGGTFEDGVERCLARVTLASKVPEDVCRAVNLGYRDPNTINPEQFTNREDQGILMVPKAGEMLYRLQES